VGGRFICWEITEVYGDAIVFDNDGFGDRLDDLPFVVTRKIRPPSVEVSRILNELIA
jgi:hypothetical protein